jgi:hypothetical protein
VKLTIRLHLQPRLRIVEIHFHFAIHLHGANLIKKPRDNFTFTGGRCVVSFMTLVALPTGKQTQISNSEDAVDKRNMLTLL